MPPFLTHRRYWIVPPAIWLLVVLFSFAWNQAETRRATHQLMLNEGRFVFRMIEATRLWNAQHGGVYGLRSDNSPSNVYLEALDKDISTPGGKHLTLLNPAYMTRQLGEVIQEQTGIRIHITSLNPINPANAALDWEAAALKSFEAGIPEYFAIADAGMARQGRYMAPLVTKQACLQCHAKQGYQTGDIRGGIGLSYSAEPFLAIQNERITQMATVHVVVWLLLSSLTLLVMHSIRNQILTLRTAKEERDRMVEERTAQLQEQIRERKQAESHLRMLINFSGEGVLGMDKSARCTFCNPVALRLLGYLDSSEILGSDLTPILHPGAEGDNPSSQPCDAIRQGKATHEEDGRFLRVDGSLLPVEYRAHPIYSEGDIVGAVVTFSDITERKQSQERIWRQANYDALTGLPNRQLLSDRLDGALSQAHRRKASVAVLFVDLDRFKEANDRLGHEAGDAILREASRRMSACLRETDTVARLGGDEFLVVLTFLDNPEDAEVVAGKIIGQLTRPFETGGGSAEISASIGIAYYPRDGDNKDALLRNADLAMYQAKSAGRSTYRLYENGLLGAAG